jgi:hypothetical protein
MAGYFALIIAFSAIIDRACQAGTVIAEFGLCPSEAVFVSEMTRHGFADALLHPFDVVVR